MPPPDASENRRSGPASVAGVPSLRVTASSCSAVAPTCHVTRHARSSFAVPSTPGLFLIVFSRPLGPAARARTRPGGSRSAARPRARATCPCRSRAPPRRARSPTRHPRRRSPRATAPSASRRRAGSPSPWPGCRRCRATCRARSRAAKPTLAMQRAPLRLVGGRRVERQPERPHRSAARIDRQRCGSCINNRYATAASTHQCFHTLTASTSATVTARNTISSQPRRENTSSCSSCPPSSGSTGSRLRPLSTSSVTASACGPPASTSARPATMPGIGRRAARSPVRARHAARTAHRGAAEQRDEEDADVAGARPPSSPRRGRARGRAGRA